MKKRDLATLFIEGIVFKKYKYSCNIVMYHCGLSLSIFTVNISPVNQNLTGIRMVLSGPTEQTATGSIYI